MATSKAPTVAAYLKELPPERRKVVSSKSCVRFRSPDDLALDAIAKVIASVPVDAYIDAYEKVRKK